jgi:hypothetical protein
MPCT